METNHWYWRSNGTLVTIGFEQWLWIPRMVCKEMFRSPPPVARSWSPLENPHSEEYLTCLESPSMGLVQLNLLTGTPFTDLRRHLKTNPQVLKFLKPESR